MGPTWVLSAPDGPHLGPMSLAIWDVLTEWGLYEMANKFADNIFKQILLNEKFYILLQISLVFVAKGSILWQ